MDAGVACGPVLQLHFKAARYFTGDRKMPRVAAAGPDLGDERIILRDNGFRRARRRDQRGAAGCRERGGKNEDRASRLKQPLDGAVHQGRSVRIVGMDLVEDHDLASEGEKPQRGVLRRQDGKQGLINRARAEGS